MPAGPWTLWQWVRNDPVSLQGTDWWHPKEHGLLTQVRGQNWHPLGLSVSAPENTYSCTILQQWNHSGKNHSFFTQQDLPRDCKAALQSLVLAFYCDKAHNSKGGKGTTDTGLYKNMGRGESQYESNANNSSKYCYSELIYTGCAVSAKSSN